MIEAKKYKVFTLNSFDKIPQVQQYLTEQQRKDIWVVGNVLPFKINNYVVDELIDWTKVPQDPIFQLTFPQRGMLSDAHYHDMLKVLNSSPDKATLKAAANKIRYELNPHPAGQEKNVPELDGTKLTGIQHKYRETLLFFPSNGQTCHAYCTFCFRWPQFVGIDELKFAMKETELLVRYLQEHPEVNDVLFTGGDPMVMSAKSFASYIEPLLDANLPNLQTIRIGTKALGYWPYKFLTDRDADDMIALFRRIVDSGIHLAFMSHFNHPAELRTDAVKEAIARIRATGAEIRTQSPIMHRINDSAETWKQMWNEQVKLGCIPYYMFVARDTGAQDYFAIDLERAYRIYQKAYQQVSGIARTARGPSMSADQGKVHVLGIDEINGEELYILRFIQGRNPKWAGKIFYAKYNPEAVWLDDLEPAFNQKQFFFEAEPKEKEALA